MAMDIRFGAGIGQSQQRFWAPNSSLHVPTDCFYGVSAPARRRVFFWLFLFCPLASPSRSYEILLRGPPRIALPVSTEISTTNLYPVQHAGTL